MLDMQDVRARYSELRKAFMESMRDYQEIRVYCFTIGSVNKLIHRRAFEDGDLTLIPRFDETCQELANRYPWLARSGDACRVVYDIISQPMQNFYPKRDELLQQAIEWSERASVAPSAVCYSSDEPF